MSTSPIKVLLVTDSLIRGGKERRLTELLLALGNNKDVKLSLILLKDQVEYPEIYSIPGLSLHVLKRRIRKDPFVFFSIYKIIRKEHPDIIHSWGSMPSVYVLPAVILLRTKFMNAMISNAINKPWSRNWFRAFLTFPFSDLIVANSRSGLEAFHVPQRKGRVIYNGFSESRLSGLESPELVRKNFNIISRYVVGMVAAFHHRKDYKTYIGTAIEILNKRKDITFVCLGDGEALEEHMAMVPREMKASILFLRQQEKVEEIINVFDIGVLTTNNLVHREGISNAIIEYMALSKPVIATRGGGTDELVLDRQTGILIDAGAGDQLVKFIEYLLNEPLLARQMGSEGEKRIREYFSMTAMVSETLKSYSVLTDN